jgi:diguanylate cyclase (GGDEF)-like protein
MAGHAETARDTSGLTSKLVLEYVERVGGRDAVQEVLERAGAPEGEAWLRDENSWFPYALKIRLFEATAEVLDDPQAMRHVGESALESSVGQGFKLALRALGSPRLVYQNIVRANARFTRTHAMELLDLRNDFARIRFVDLIRTEFAPLDCQYNVGMLSTVPGLFGLPRAKVTHPECAGDGDESCVYELSWDGRGRWMPQAIGSAAGSAVALGAAALFAPALLPVAAAVPVVAGALVTRRIVASRRARWDELRMEVSSNADATDKLLSSMQDLVGELRIEDLLAKIAENAQATIPGKDFLLLLDYEGKLEAVGEVPVPAPAVATLEAWANDTARLGEEVILLDDLVSVPALAALPDDEEMPLRSLCAAPLHFRGERLGVLVTLAQQPRVFLPRDVDLVEGYAAQAAIALSNARMYRTQELLASHDPLTGLANHREFHETFARELERSRRNGSQLSVVLLDLDDFKEVNDRHGHAHGDHVLERVGAALRRHTRAGDVACRIGGDEFATLLPDASAEDAAAAAARMRTAVGEADERLGASIGVATWPQDGGSKDVLIAEADARLYAAKAGRDARIARRRRESTA